MGSTTDLRRELKRTFLPFMADRGFVLDQRHAPHFLDFRRIVDSEVHFAEIQWEKYGTPRFALNAGAASAAGTLCHGEFVPAGDVGPGQAPAYVRVYPRGTGTSTRHWFRQDNTWLTILKTGRRVRPAEDVVSVRNSRADALRSRHKQEAGIARARTRVSDSAELAIPVAMQRLVELIGLIVRNAGFAWDSLDHQLSNASKSFWAVSVDAG